MQSSKSKFICEVEKEVREMGYDSCDEEWSGLKWFILLERVWEKKEKSSKSREQKK